MQKFRMAAIAASTTAALITTPAIGAVIDTLDLDTDGTQATAPTVGHRLNVEITVRNWVLCAAEPFAETLVRARQEGRDAAAKAYADLEQARSCGRLNEMQVILQEPLYDASIGADGHAGVYSALINISGAWAAGFVVYGGLPEEH